MTMYDVTIKTQATYRVKARDKAHAESMALMIHADPTNAYNETSLKCYVFEIIQGDRADAVPSDLDFTKKGWGFTDDVDAMVDAACEAYVTPTRTLSITPKHQFAIESAEILMSICNPETASDLREILNLIDAAE